MNETRIFRRINTIETKFIINSIKTISTELLPIFDSLKELLYILINKSTTKNDYPSIYLITDKLQKILNNINFLNRIYDAGLYFGFIKRGEFYFSIEGVEYLYKNGIFTNFKLLHLNGNGEKSFLYGNNILKKMVRKSPNNLKKEDFLLILNNFDEIIGLGISRVNNEILSNLKPSDVFAINIKDKGQYLRRRQ
ncbi:unnamed protein product [marine sediment metagenome]|uniref:PUA domain-containing protein n=1 Tax=marine sediment metagenome TaxID=412755 RepID=X0YM72_9ZZZZ